MPWSIPSPIKKWFTSSSSSRDENWTTHTANLTALFCLSRPAPPRPALPPEIIVQILSHPTRWLLTHSRSSGRDYVTDDQKPIILLPPFTANDLKSLRRIVFRFRSKDQGFSWDRSNHGTYNGSWTWFEAVVREPHAEVDSTGSPPLLGGDPIFPVIRESHNQHVRKRWELQRNRHAGRFHEDYEVVFEDGDERMTELKEVMREGDHLELRACAAFPAWANQVDRANVEIWCSDDLKSREGH